ncbi:cell division protein FtsQ/DivIB [Salinisphaera sp. LB1]|uniref:cell division protein FtsQ/DivIB n=1 Tax=Salinisphaera sp. LB1 TaxID=2183911 RepID=UPI000D707364|nr:cell division protein FtsQ/DivIB [Salinisphaera sp. LB1]AWN16527.1 Cell division protein FtsQ [Salinisphaera sp. LB1]
MKWINARRLRDGALGAIVLLGVAACTWQGIKPDNAGPRRLYISGKSAHVSDQQIAQMAAPYLKASFFDVDTAALKARIASRPWLTDVRVSRHWPDGVVVHVADHKPVAAWGDKSVLAADGQVFTPDTRPQGLIQLNGPAKDSAKVYAQYRHLSGILAGHGVHLASLELKASGDWQARLDDGLELRLGRDQLAARMQRFVRFALARPRARRALAGAGYVDLRYSDGFAVGGSRHETASASHEESVG